MPDVMKTVGRYEVLLKVGRGGMAVVYKARQQRPSRYVALKELRALHDDDPSYAQRFLREADLTGSLSHPNIVTVFDYFEHEGTPYIAMEYVERGSLRPYVGKMTLTQIGGVLEGLLAGLTNAEQNGIVHRDLKPENLMVTSDGRVKIADFGIAKATTKMQTGAFLTATGTTVGTPTYMAPEQAMAQDIGPWTDLYSVGCMAFELFTGRVPFHDSDAQMAILLRHVNEPIRAVKSIDPSIDQSVSDWIEKLLVKDPAKRTQSAADAWDEFEEIIIGLLGPRWRRDARLTDEIGAADTPNPLTPAPFQGPTTDAVASDEFQSFEWRQPAADADGYSAPAPFTPPPQDLPSEPMVEEPAPEAPPPPGLYTRRPQDPPGSIEGALSPEDPPAPESASSAPPAAAPVDDLIYNTFVPAPEARPSAQEPPTDELEPLRRAGGQRAEPPPPVQQGDAVLAPRQEAGRPLEFARERVGEHERLRAGGATPRPGGVDPATRRTEAPAVDAAAATLRQDNTLRSRRTPRSIVVIAVVSLAVVGAALVATSGPQQENSTSGEPTAAPRVALESGPLALTLPAGWEAPKGPMAIPNLELNDAAAASPDGNRDAVVATLGVASASASNFALLPRSFLESLGAGPMQIPPREAVSLGPAQLHAYHYDDLTLRGFGRAVDLYVVPTSAGVATVACAAPTDSPSEARCEGHAATLTVHGVDTFEVGPDAQYAQMLERTLGRTATRLKSAWSSLKRARTARRQAAALESSAAAFAVAAQSLGVLTLSPYDEQVHGRLVAALRRAATAHRESAQAARGLRRRSYSLWAARAERAQERLEQALRALEVGGYRRFVTVDLPRNDIPALRVADPDPDPLPPDPDPLPPDPDPLPPDPDPLPPEPDPLPPDPLPPDPLPPDPLPPE